MLNFEQNTLPISNEVLAKHPEVTWSEGLGRRGNLEQAFSTHKSDNPEFWAGLRGKSVWLKPNMVDLEHPDACTNPNALQVTLEQLASSGADKIYVGDIPAMRTIDKLDRNELRFNDIFDKLGYKEVVDKLKQKFPNLKVELLDPRMLEEQQLEETGVRITKPPEDVKTIVSLVSPKEHGQYQFTCATKSLMGLSLPKDRHTYFHNHGNDNINSITTELTSNPKYMEAIQKKALEETGIAPSEVMEPDNLKTFTHAYNSILISDIHLTAAERTNQKNAGRMSKFIQETTEYLSQKGVQVLTVVDGMTFMTGHEHEGIVNNLNIAAVGLNPLSIDELVAERVGTQAGYLNDLSKAMHGAPELKGKFGKQIPLRRAQRIMHELDIKENGTYSYWFGIDSDIPTDGFEGYFKSDELLPGDHEFIAKQKEKFEQFGPALQAAGVTPEQIANTWEVYKKQALAERNEKLSETKIIRLKNLMIEAARESGVNPQEVEQAFDGIAGWSSWITLKMEEAKKRGVVTTVEEIYEEVQSLEFETQKKYRIGLHVGRYSLETDSESKNRFTKFQVAMLMKLGICKEGDRFISDFDIVNKRWALDGIDVIRMDCLGGWRYAIEDHKSNLRVSLTTVASSNNTNNYLSFYIGISPEMIKESFDKQRN